MDCAIPAYLLQNRLFKCTIAPMTGVFFEQASTLATKYKPQLDHIGFDWSKDVANFVQKLLLVEKAILEKARFTGNSGCIYFTSPKGFITAQTTFMNDIVGALALAAAVQMDGGFKAANKIVATLSAVAKNPGVIKTRSVESEAMGLIAANYQRGAEPRGIYWFDVYQDDNAQEPDLAQISWAAERAIIELRADIQNGRPESLVLSILATRFRELFLRYNDVATRHSEAADGKIAQVEAGPFLEFLKLVIAPLNEFFATLPPAYGAKPISPVQVARKAGELSRRHR